MKRVVVTNGRGKKGYKVIIEFWGDSYAGHAQIHNVSPNGKAIPFGGSYRGMHSHPRWQIHSEERTLLRCESLFLRLGRKVVRVQGTKVRVTG